MSFYWEGKAVQTIGDIMKHVEEIAKSDNKDRAKSFFDAYYATNQHAAQNIGYLSGYFDKHMMKKVQELFEVEHPIFGKTAPSAVEAFNKGMELGIKHKRLNEDEDSFMSDLEKI